VVTTEAAGARRSLHSRAAFVVVHGILAAPWIAGLGLALTAFAAFVTGASRDPHGFAALLAVAIGVVSVPPVLAIGVAARRWRRGSPLGLVIVDGVLSSAALVWAAVIAGSAPTGDVAVLVLYAGVAGAGAGLAAMIRP
jgi:hypothetical protein